MTELMVPLPEEVAERVETVARERGVAPQDLAREAIEAYLPSVATVRPLSIIGIGHSGIGDLAERSEEILQADFPG